MDNCFPAYVSHPGRIWFGAVLSFFLGHSRKDALVFTLQHATGGVQETSTPQHAWQWGCVADVPMAFHPSCPDALLVPALGV